MLSKFHTETISKVRWNGRAGSTRLGCEARLTRRSLPLHWARPRPNGGRSSPPIRCIARVRWRSRRPRARRKGSSNLSPLTSSSSGPARVRLGSEQGVGVPLFPPRTQRRLSFPRRTRGNERSLPLYVLFACPAYRMRAGMISGTRPLRACMAATAAAQLAPLRKYYGLAPHIECGPGMHRDFCMDGWDP